MKQKEQSSLDHQGKLDVLITQALEERVAGAESTASREAFLAYVRAVSDEQEARPSKTAGSEDILVWDPHHDPRERRATDLFQAISRLTGPIMDIIR